MHPNPFAIAFMCFWFWDAGKGLIDQISLHQTVDPISLAMFVVGLALLYGVFWFEARKAKAALRGILQRSVGQP